MSDSSETTHFSRQALTSFFTALRSPEILLPNFTAAAILAIMNVTTAISIAALVFSGPLAPYLPTGIGLLLVSTAVGGLLVASFSGYKGIVAGPRSGQAPIVASLAAGVVLTMSGKADEAVVATVVVTILIASLLISVVLFGLGWAKLGGLARYVPYPVMGGFFAGLGFLLLKGGILVTLGSLVSPDHFASFLTTDVALHLAPALLFAVLLYLLDQRIKHWSLMPAYLLATVIIFYAVLFSVGSSVETAALNQWLPTISVAESSFFPVIKADQLGLVDWTAVLAQSSTILIMMLMSVIMLLLDTSGVEIVIDRDLDPNHELRAAGMANVISGLCTGVIAIQAAADTAFAHKLGGNRFLMIILYTIFVAAVIVAGPSPIAYVPTLMLGGLLMYIGIDFLMTWVWSIRKKIPPKDFAVVCGILFVVAAYGLLEGVAVGVVLTIILFVHSYSQLSVIKSDKTGTEHVSNVDRNQEQTKYLDEHGGKFHIFVLQGFLFFGTASRLLDDIRSLLDDPKRQDIRYLILDFYAVDELDTSAINSFAKLLQICKKGNMTLVVTGCSQVIEVRFRNLIEGIPEAADTLRIFDDLDHGVAWCGDQILESMDAQYGDDDPINMLTQLLGDRNAAEIVSSKFRKLSVRESELVFEQGEPGDALYLILSGAVSVVLNLPSGQNIHLRTMRAGAILGEMALYTGADRSATAVVKESGELYRLDQNSYNRLNENHPAEAGALHSFIVRLMSDRLARANKAIVALSR